MQDLIDMPETAKGSDFDKFLDENEARGFIDETKGGSKFVAAAPGELQIGQVIVEFAKAHGPSESRRSAGPFLGWRKVRTGYRITGTGVAYQKDGKTLVNYYVSAGA